MNLVRGARRNPSAILLVVQLLGVLVYPAMEGSRGGRVGFEILGIVVLTLAVFSVRSTPGLTWVSVCLGIPAVVLSLVDVFWPSEVVVPISKACCTRRSTSMRRTACCGTCCPTMTSAPTSLWATGATFTLVAWGFAYCFVFVQALVPGSFTAAVNPQDDRTWMELLFLSFTTLSSTGLSDIVPISSWGRSVVMIEQLAGLGYVAMVVSRLVGLTVAKRR